MVVERGWVGRAVRYGHRPLDRRRGVATALLQHAASWAAEQGAQQGDLQVEQDNLPALRRYRRVGFQPSNHYHYRIPTP